VFSPCILNQTRLYWLHSNVLFATFSICTKLQVEYQVQVLVNSLLACGEFDQELEILYAKIALEVINVLDLCLAFVVTFNLVTTHNMCALRLDSRFKSL